MRISDQKWFLFNVLLLITAPCLSLADEVTKLSTMVISTPLQRKLAETIQPVNVLEGNELRLKAASTIGATLSQELGIHNMSFGGNVGHPVIRGQTGVRVKLLQNSISSLDVSAVSPDHANSTEAILADRIEVLRGPATLLYGSGAIGGVVNIIDNRIPENTQGDHPQTALEQRFNTVSSQWSTVFRHDGGLDKFAWHLDGFYRTSRNTRIPGPSVNPDVTVKNIGRKGFIPNSDAKTWSGTMGGSWVDDWGFMGLSINRLESNYGVPPVDEIVRIDLVQTRYDMKAEIFEPFDWAETLKLRLGYNVYKHTELENGVIAGTSFNNDALEGRVELIHDELGLFDHGAIGFQGLHRNFQATGAEAFVPKSKILSFGFFSLEDIDFKSFTLELGLRVEHQIIDAESRSSVSHTPVSASISALWHVDERSLISVSLTRAQRAPDVQELFSNGAHFATQSFERGDAQLTEETSYNLELNFKTDYQWMSAELNLFHNWSQDYIAALNTGTLFNLDSEQTVSRCGINDRCLPILQTTQLNARFYGFETELNFPLWSHDDSSLAVKVFSDFVRGQYKHADVPRMPSLRYGAQMDYQLFKDVSGNIRLTRGEAQNKPGDNETKTGSYLLLNTGFNYRPALGKHVNLLLFAKGNNLLNQSIRNSTSFLRNFAPESGRGVELGLRIQF